MALDPTQIKTTSDDSRDDFIPVPPIPASTTPEPGATRATLSEKLRAARLAMQGVERTIKRERSERERAIELEKAELEQSLALVTKKKEDLEIGWVVLDNKRVDLKKMLAPILDEEDKLETAEEELEGKERTAGTPTDRQQIEKERWALQDKRKELEKEKWGFEDKILKIETLIKENTDKYQGLLDEEESLLKKIDNLDNELTLLSEQVRLEAEEAKHKADIAAAEAERKRREEIAKQEQLLAEKKRAEELAKKTAEEKQKQENEAKVKAEAAQKEAEQKKQAAATQAMAQAKTAAATQTSIDETRRKALELATLRARGDAELARQRKATSNTTPEKPEQITKEVKEILATTLTPKATPAGTDIPKATPEEENSLPKLRTLKTDMERLQGKR